MQQVTLTPPDSDGPHPQLNHNAHLLKSKALAPSDGSLRPDKAKLEQLAYLLLDLLSTDSEAELPETTTQPISSHTANDASPSPLSSQETDPKQIPFTSQEILKPMALWPEQTSQILLVQKPWLHEKVIVDVVHVENEPSGPNVEAEMDTGLEPGVESIPLTTVQPARTVLPTTNLQEDSLYLLENNHAWVDLHTSLGPGKFTDKGREYWLTRRKGGGWPTIIAPNMRAQYLIDAWSVMTARSPNPDPRYEVTSALAYYDALVDLRQTLGRKFVRHPTFRYLTLARDRKKGLVSNITFKVQAVSRALFSTADPVRARLPSTSFLRIIGQKLFVATLSSGQDRHAETLWRFLVVSLNAIAAGSVTGNRGESTPSISRIATTSESSNIESQEFIAVWHLLAACYRAQVVQQPPPEADDTLLWEQVDSLFSALHLVNIFTPQLDMTWLHSIGLEQLLSSNIKSMCSKATLRKRETVYPHGKSEYFGKKDVNVKTLQYIGALNILWTRYVDEHLTLDTQSSEIRIFWPAWALANLPCTQIFSPGPGSDVLKDLLATYSFLFYSSGGLYAAISDYNGLDPPTWLSSMSTPLSELTKNKSLIGDTRYHFDSYNPTDAQAQLSNATTAMMRFDACGMFENRVRILKAYMDSQKPSGLAALWRDKRDTGQWYTFWLVFWVGGISILLGVTSLAVSIAQTFATFEALRYLAIALNLTTSTARSNDSVEHSSTTLRAPTVMVATRIILPPR